MVALNDLTNTVLYFNKSDMFLIMDSQRMEANKAVQSLNPDELLNTPTEDIVTRIVEKYCLDIPVLLRDKAHLEEPRETTLTINDYGRTIHPIGTVLTLVVPFTGDAGMFWVRPTSFDSMPPRGNLNGNELVLKMSGVNLNKEAVTKNFNSTLDVFERYLGWQRSSAGEFNAGLGVSVRQSVEARKARLLADRDLVASLPFQIRARPDAPRTYVAPVTRKTVVTRPPQGTTAPFKPEPVLAGENYNEILAIIHSMTLVMERSPKAFAKMGEEDIRQHYLVQLNGHFEGAATGETFNFNGKTDILIRVEDRNIFIAECKFWKGEQSFIETIDQILSYLSWRDTKAAIILFNRNKNFTEVLAKVKEAAKAHPHYKKGPGVEGETQFRYVFGNPNDHNREVTLTVMVFDIPVAEP
jgi:hypothetical protein